MASSGKQITSYLQNPEEIKKVFSRFDKSGDGKISADEFRGVVNALAGADDVCSAEEAQRMMEEMDTDRDGYISVQEFTDFCSAGADPYGSADKELKEAFDLYDQDHDGRISREELHHVLNRLGEGRSVGDCAGMIQSVDCDGDGYVGFEEFKKMMTTS